MVLQRAPVVGREMPGRWALRVAEDNVRGAGVDYRGVEESHGRFPQRAGLDPQEHHAQHRGARRAGPRHGAEHPADIAHVAALPDGFLGVLASDHQVHGPSRHHAELGARDRRQVRRLLLFLLVGARGRRGRNPGSSGASCRERLRGGLRYRPQLELPAYGDHEDPLRRAADPQAARLGGLESLRGGQEPVGAHLAGGEDAGWTAHPGEVEADQFLCEVRPRLPRDVVCKGTGHVLRTWRYDH
mmetsp:Transcript_112489/g.281786  ORF Transcript_112489/g.281786 Transcript_112489/m.281786 type:complete len:243 (-) Transcript_112489:1544-2272(-)